MNTTRQPKQKQTYTQIIMAHLMAGKTITNMQAYDEYAITCLAQRISELRASGVSIDDEMVTQNGKRFKRYWIDQPTPQTIEGA
ncbi:helix-turn-helix domain-containing protein [Psychrobacter pacificensis]|uniref:helix-turn-helix domain-containing protein n=1 Tax=Psychrobacter pacificensis TaxID=112002 RepID=UPI0028C45CD4|nr:helix-turn-helix domain-containing protein [Psychrobacter pacificensis]